MSEHEGFCVPILEAQYHNIPIIALDRAAVKETLGIEQLIYEKVDYGIFSSAIYTLITDIEIHTYLAKQGYNNFLKYETGKISERMLNAVQNIIVTEGIK
jgi:glycosyltransferase involved in cell wall biosynthesis